MALVSSNPFEIGNTAPDFTLLDTVSNTNRNLQQLKGEKATVILFICNHCPFVIHINDQLIKLAHDYRDKGVCLIAISSNDVVKYPQDGPEFMKKQANALGYPFPYLYDETQQVAKLYDAACTPDIYVFDVDLKATYHGQLDDSRPGNGLAVTGTDIREAIDAILNQKSLITIQKPSIGCSIKWK